MNIVKNVKIFADGADLPAIMALYQNPLIKGFTTNPTLMRKAGIDDYEAFARKLLEAVPDRPISFEVFADDFDEMIAQGRVIASWGENVNVKVPVTTTKGAFTGPVVPPRCSVRNVMTIWMTTSTSGPPRLCSITAIAEVGPMRSTPTLAIA